MLIIGLGSGSTLGSALTHPVASATAVEISPEVKEFARNFPLFTWGDEGMN